MVKQPPVRTRSAERRVAVAASMEDRFAQLTAQFDVLKAQVRQAQQLAGLGTAAATIAHEVNNLLTPILSYADAALQSGDGPLAQKALTVTARNVRMLIAMSDRILELGAAKPRERESVRVRQAVDDALASLCRDPSKDGISLSIAVEESLTVFADPLQLRQVLFNLFLNAREAMAPSHSGRLSVTASSGPKGVAIEVRNTGPAIPPDLLPHLFEPFQSTKRATRDGKARCSGLGLALVRDLVEENDGTIDVSSDQTGTTFRIRFPNLPPAVD